MVALLYKLIFQIGDAFLGIFLVDQQIVPPGSRRHGRSRPHSAHLAGNASRF
jgi:hypothetical protein